MSITAMKQALEALEIGWSPKYVNGVDAREKGMTAITSLRQAIAEAEKQDGDCKLCGDKGCVACDARKQEPVACDGDFPEGFDGSFGIPAQALRQANAALCEVTNNRMWDVPALAERMLAFSHPQPKREPLTFEQVEDCFPEGASVFEDAYGDNHTSPRWLHAFARAIEAAHGIKGEA